jgi:hypothetical protein
MDQNTIITIVGSASTIILLMLGIFLWIQSEINIALRTLQAIHRENHKDVLELIKNIQFEIKDFHNRLCAIEQIRREKL